MSQRTERGAVTAMDRWCDAAVQTASLTAKARGRTGANAQEPAGKELRLGPSFTRDLPLAGMGRCPYWSGEARSADTNQGKHKADLAKLLAPSMM